MTRTCTSLASLFLLGAFAPAAHAQASFSCGGVDDTAAIITALGALPAHGGVLTFPAGGNCVITNGLKIGYWAAINPMTNLTIDGNGATLTARHDMTSTDSHGVTHSTAANPASPMLTVSGVHGVTIRDLTLDGNRLGRSSHWGITSSAAYGHNGNLWLMAVRDAVVEDVVLLEALSDGVNVGGVDAYPSERIDLVRLHADGADRNNITVVDCRDCAIVDSDLYRGGQNIDLEPHSDPSNTRRVVDMEIRGNLLSEGRGRCMSISHDPLSEIRNVLFEGNHVEGCKTDFSTVTHGRVFKISASQNTQIVGNTFDDIDAWTWDGGGNSMIRFQGARDVLFRDNVFLDVHYDVGMNLIYLWNDAGLPPTDPGFHAQTTVHIENNQLLGTPYLSHPQMWCTVFSSPVRSIVETNTFGNLVPNAFGGHSVAPQCTM